MKNLCHIFTLYFFFFLHYFAINILLHDIFWERISFWGGNCYWTPHPYPPATCLISWKWYIMRKGKKKHFQVHMFVYHVWRLCWSFDVNTCRCYWLLFSSNAYKDMRHLLENILQVQETTCTGRKSEWFVTRRTKWWRKHLLSIQMSLRKKKKKKANTSYSRKIIPNV